MLYWLGPNSDDFICKIAVWIMYDFPDHLLMPTRINCDSSQVFDILGCANSKCCMSTYHKWWIKNKSWNKSSDFKQTGVSL